MTAKQREAVEKFREAAWIAKAAPAEDQMASRKLAHGSQFLPRDLQYMAIYGRLCTLFFTNGERRYQLASRYDITELLDILGFKSGSILVRGETFWETVDPPTEPSILANLGDGPRWLTPAEAGAGGGGFEGVTMMTSGVSTVPNAATLGTIVIPTQNVEINQIMWQQGGASGGQQFRGGIVPMSGPLGSKVVDGTPVWGNFQLPRPTERLNIMRDTLATPVICLAGQPYLLMVQLDTTTPTDFVRNWVPNNNVGWLQNGPFEVHAESYAFNTLPIVSGSTPFWFLQQPFYIACNGKPLT